jgi:DNA-binding transcriptional regulator YdaS (Cro superfamily)
MTGEEKLFLYLKNHGIMQSWFAKKLGISRSFFVQIKTGERWMPMKYYPIIEELTHGAITAKDFKR